MKNQIKRKYEKHHVFFRYWVGGPELPGPGRVPHTGFLQYWLHGPVRGRLPHLRLAVHRSGHHSTRCPVCCLSMVNIAKKKLLIERIDRLRRSQSFFMDVLSSYSSYFLFYHSFFLSSVENSKHSHTKTMFWVIKKTKLQNFKFCV